MTVKLRVDTRDLDRLVVNGRRAVDQLVQDAYDHFVSITPVRSGNARRNTNLQGRSTITADYPYAERLDTGWSRQAPEGMTAPTEEFIAQQAEQLAGRTQNGR